MQHTAITKTKADNKQENVDIHIDRIHAQKLIEEYIQDPIIRMHVRESEVIMQAVAKRLGFDQTVWGIIGLLHDIDWEQTKTDTKKHGILAAELLKKAGGSDFLIETIQSHVYGQGTNDSFMGPPEFKDKKRSTVLQHALAASETLTGLIIATALIQPEKKLAAVKLDSLKKKFNTRKFAAGCNREIIRECEQIGIPIDEFLNIGLQAIQQIHGELSL
jgi:putative nucleotidyltransferase with HDIG domain